MFPQSPLTRGSALALEPRVGGGFFPEMAKRTVGKVDPSLAGVLLHWGRGPKVSFLAGGVKGFPEPTMETKGLGAPALQCRYRIVEPWASD
ncbi:hypothetical protein NDU88_002619 [Pleurodeles waltl]|uniref:Uncharacterized protein n=1 Tax=Pleurodeles waltl TaxID=8319 RepID=A0AAV7REB3_PLEWA|nr:hypothetical protein NDU88_002619 [Pleurodeles waltl]